MSRNDALVLMPTVAAMLTTAVAVDLPIAVVVELFKAAVGLEARPISPRTPDAVAMSSSREVASLALGLSPPRAVAKVRWYKLLL
jgi:hypothetical protein